MSDKLPPHSIEAEQCVLGCILAAPNAGGQVLAEAIEYLGGGEPFYDLKHRTILQAMCGLRDENKGIDIVTVIGRLKDSGNLDGVGGASYVAGLPDRVPSAANLEYYLQEVWEKFVARQTIQYGQSVATRALSGSVSEMALSEMEGKLLQLKTDAVKGLKRKPQYLARPSEFEQEYFNEWFRPREKGEPGWDLPISFPLRIRTHEMTLFTGDSGSGKSSFIGQTCIVLGKQGVKCCIASMEVHPAVSLWIMARQLLGVGRLPDSVDGHMHAAKALNWLEEWVILYNFLGITQWQDVLETFRFAHEHHGIGLGVVDSVMRIGIPDDDYATQALVAARFADFSVKTGVHTFLVVHENKGEGGMKHKVSGSKKWTDNAHNVAGMRRNAAKETKLSELKEDLKAKIIDQKAYNEGVEKLRVNWDSKFVLEKQRYPGSQQNGSRYLWFDRGSLQFLEEPSATPYDYLNSPDVK